MLICKDDIAYRCSKIKTKTVEETQIISFTILDKVSSADIAGLFEDNAFYFYDDVLKCGMVETNNTKLVGLSITYNADSTANIKLKLTKGDVDNES